MTIVHLARHGSHAEVGHILSGRSEIGLSERGQAEAEWLAARLADVPIGVIRSSPRARTMATAACVAGRHGLVVAACPALDEIDFAGWTGKSFASLHGDPAWQSWNMARGAATVPGGESIADVLARALPALRHEGPGDLLCVTHCDVIRAIVAHLLGLSLDHMLRFDCDPASLTSLQLHEDGSARLLTLNERPR